MIYLFLTYIFLGAGRLFTLLKILQVECDRQSRQILQQFKSKRNFDHVVSSINKVSVHRCTCPFKH